MQVSKKYFFFILLLINAISSYGQTEYLVTVNPSTGAITKLDSIPTVKWLVGSNMPAYSEYQHNYTFVGGNNPSGNPFHLFTVNGTTGAVINNPLFTDHSYFNCLRYSQTSNLLYGVWRNSISNISYIVKVNTISGLYTILYSLTDMAFGLKLMIDDVNNRFIIYGLENVPGRTFWTMDIGTGNIISKCYPSAIINPDLNKINNTLYAISIQTPVYPQTRTTYRFCSVNINSGAVTNIKTIPNLAGLSTGYETIDQNAQRYFFSGYEWNDTSTYLYTIDINNGNIIKKVSIPQRGTINDDNLVAFRYDNNNNKLYALFWEARTMKQPPTVVNSCLLNSTVKIYENSQSQKLIIDKGPTLCKISVNVYNAMGQCLLYNKIIGDGRNEIQINNLLAGIYFYQFVSEGKILLTGKFLASN